MHPQQPWLMRLNAEQLQRDVEQNMRIRQAREAARQQRPGRISNLRHFCGAALIAIGAWIQPVERPAREHESTIEFELAR